MNLLTEENIPPDCAALLLYSPASDLSQEEIDKIEAHLAENGSLMLFTDCDAEDLPRLHAMMAKRGVEAVDGMVVEGDSSYFMSNYPNYLIPQLENHEITEPLISGNYYVLMPMTQGLKITAQTDETEQAEADETDASLSVTALLSTTADAYSKIKGLQATDAEKEDGDIDGETYALQKDADANWQWPEDPEFPVSQTTVSYMEYALADITATRALENVTDFAQYGLDEPQSVISYTTADGASVEILTGDYNDVSGEYYAQLAGEHTVYTVSGDYMEDFQYTIDDLLQVESLPIYEEDTELRVTADGKTTVYDLTKNAGDETDETDADTGDSADSDETSSEAEEDGDTVSTAQEIVDGVRGLNFETYVTYKADKAALASYGLDKPQMSFTVKGKQTADDGGSTAVQFTLQVGSKIGSSYYVRLKDSKMVYTVSADEINALCG